MHWRGRISVMPAGVISNCSSVPASRSFTIVADAVREKTLQSLAAEKQEVWSGLSTSPADRMVLKNRYSALIQG